MVEGDHRIMNTVNSLMKMAVDTFLNRPEQAYKKGGKVVMSNKQVVNVKVNVGDQKKKAPKPRKARKLKPLGDTIMLRAGNVPAPKRPGLHVRFLSPGSAFGGGLPGPLNSASYASAPPVAQPLGRLDFISSGGDGLHSRGRDKRNDFQPPANPSGIRADVSPSMRAVSSSGAVETPDAGLALSRSLRNSYDALSPEYQRIYDNMEFQGEVPRIGGANLQPSSRIAKNQPSSGWAEMSRYKAQEYVPPPASLAEASSSKSAMASVSQPGRERMTSPQRRSQAERENYPEEQLYGPPKGKRQPPVDSQSLRRGGSVF